MQFQKSLTPIFIIRRICIEHRVKIRIMSLILFGLILFIKSSFSEKATKFRKNCPLVLTLLIKNSCFAKTGGRFLQILWPSHNILTLPYLDAIFCFGIAEFSYIFLQNVAIVYSTRLQQPQERNFDWILLYCNFFSTTKDSSI